MSPADWMTSPETTTLLLIFLAILAICAPVAWMLSEALEDLDRWKIADEIDDYTTLPPMHWADCPPCDRACRQGRACPARKAQG